MARDYPKRQKNRPWLSQKMGMEKTGLNPAEGVEQNSVFLLIAH